MKNKMLLRKEHIDEQGLIGIRRIAGKPEYLLSLLPEKQQAEAEKYISKIRSDRRIIEWLTTRVLLFIARTGRLQRGDYRLGRWTYACDLLSNPCPENGFAASEGCPK